LGDFLGHSRKAIEWQVWTALLMHLLLRFLHACSTWGHSFTSTTNRTKSCGRFGNIHYGATMPSS
jgi:hypothetical protein